MRNASANPHCEGAMIAPPGSPAHSALPPEESAHHLAPGVVVNVRSRRYLVEDVTLPKNGDLTRVALACLDDDAQGSQLTVLWEREVDASILSAATWDDVASHGFDKPRQFSAYLHTLRWNCVTSTDAELFQAPYRAGIEVKAYQLEPLRKALAMPRVNLFIADDVGLGKTIEAGLIIRELLLRQKVSRIVISAPPSVVLQWRNEMEQRFGLPFVVYDRDYVSRKRQERGFSVNPWRTHSRFIISHALLRNEAYAAPLRDWMGDFGSGSLLIIDEAHNAAPASGAKYAIDSKLTRAVRDIAKRFEHRLFLSATPHNGHSNSFAALLEMLDPNRFCRGVPVKDPRLLDAVMVRRLKIDLQPFETGFPTRKVVKVSIDGLANDAPALVLSRLLQQYREAREQRLKDVGRRAKAAEMLVIAALQKRLLSSIDAFALTLAAHKRGMAKRRADADAKAAAARAKNADPNDPTEAADPTKTTEPTDAEPTEEDAEREAAEQFELLAEAVGADDERADLDEKEVHDEALAQMEAASAQTVGHGDLGPELHILQRMIDVADRARYMPDERVQWLIDWIRDHQCADLGQDGAQWNGTRLLIFTEYTDTKNYLLGKLNAAIARSDQAGERIGVFSGHESALDRELIKEAFNTEPTKHPLRILLATDAAREGVNLQNHCADLVHFDIPWNPGRMEQRNGRIDRKLQRSSEVRCHYFVLPQRAEDRVLEVLVQKTERIRRELGSLSPVVERRISKALKGGIRHDAASQIALGLDGVDRDEPTADIKTNVVDEELEAVRKRRQELKTSLDELRALLDKAQRWTNLRGDHFRDALSVALRMLGAPELEPVDPSRAARDPETAQWRIPKLHEKKGADPTWTATIDTLRAPRKRGQKLWDWRREAPIRPVVFRDPGTIDQDVVHLHLEQRVVQRLLGRFLAMGFVHDELSRACVVMSDEAFPQVLVLGRLSLYGQNAARLHDEIIAVAARWHEPEQRGRGGLKAVAEAEKRDIIQLLEMSLAKQHLRAVPDGLLDRLKGHVGDDVKQLKDALDYRAGVQSRKAKRSLASRAKNEAEAMRLILERQAARIRKHAEQVRGKRQLVLDLDVAELRQLKADQDHWERRIVSLQQEIVDEPKRVEASYAVKVDRVEPVGVVYLWPRSG